MEMIIYATDEKPIHVCLIGFRKKGKLWRSESLKN